eukprot:766932-Hanusia_phi.AAC.3
MGRLEKGVCRLAEGGTPVEQEGGPSSKVWVLRRGKELGIRGVGYSSGNLPPAPVSNGLRATHPPQCRRAARVAATPRQLESFRTSLIVPDLPAPEYNN